MTEFRNNPLGESVFKHKYALSPSQSWHEKARHIVEDVTGKGAYGQFNHPLLSQSERDFLVHAIANMWFIPGGRYVYYAGRPAKFYNNCYIGKAREDSREEWARIARWATDCLMTGGGIGNDYSIFRHEGAYLSRTGGTASGPIPLMKMLNEIGRNVMQGGSRRSAIYASLNWQHLDIEKFLVSKNWGDATIGKAITEDGKPYSYHDLKMDDFNGAAPLDMTNISVNYDDAWLDSEHRWTHPTFVKNIEQAMRNGEPGFSFNFRDKQEETGRNACTEVTSSDHGDVCNLGSVNMGAIPDLTTFGDVVRVAAKLLVCGTIRSEVPTKEIATVREKNRRIGLGLMGMHEWMLKRSLPYGMTPELREWMEVYRAASQTGADEHCDRLYINRPVAYRSLAPTGTIGIIAGTTTGLEPLYATAYKRRFLVGNSSWRYQYKIDAITELMVKQYGINPDNIETASSLANDPARRIQFQADVQDYIDMAISSTLNLPAWGSDLNNPDRVEMMAAIVSQYASRLRGLTFYPDGSRGGQPLEPVPYAEAVAAGDAEFEENSACRDGVCGI